MVEFQEKTASFIEMEELYEAKKADKQNIEDTTEDKKNPKGWTEEAKIATIELLAEVEWEKQLAREAQRKDGLALEDVDEEEDYLGIAPLIERLEKKQVKDLENVDQYWEPTNSESDDDKRFSSVEVKKQLDEFEKKCKRHLLELL
ncbi:hypothetical protein Cni_G13575 [Canna indica]|uniref:Uncharacterized protein n=1 Tax=Canna indica TaxID=4628 RepID=A0AAQ3KCV4_9LILI|nr:hypothetical protein Cni_G13575 [Canna indica]